MAVCIYCQSQLVVVVVVVAVVVVITVTLIAVFKDMTGTVQ